ncbi:glycoside hydrolase family 5 protein [Poronia punctata]|nr:glycoside hydrolase family 5 protein [Poronia punctata]
MKSTFLSFCALAAWASSSALAADATSWMGTNLYFLQGLSDSDQDAYIDAIASYGVKVVRVWANRQSGGSCEKGSKIEKDLPAFETTVGEYNFETLDALDLVMEKLSQKGIKVVISPHDGNSLIGDYRKDVYYDNWGTSGFYTNSVARDAYKNRFDAIVNYKGKHSGKVWKDWTDAILAFDIQNEPMCADTSICQNNDESGWLCDIALSMRESLGGNNSIKIATGGIGGDESHGCTVIDAATSCGQIDIIAAHKYAGLQADNGGQWSGSAANWLEKAGDKLVMVEEWGVDATAAYQPDEFAAQAADIDAGGVPSLYWQFLAAQNPDCPYDPKSDSGDHFGIFVEGDADIGSVVGKSNAAAAKQDWSPILPN